MPAYFRSDPRIVDKSRLRKNPQIRRICDVEKRSDPLRFPSTMKSPAVVNYAPEKGAVEICEVVRPEIGATGVLREVANLDVRGSDRHEGTADLFSPVNTPVVPRQESRSGSLRCSPAGNLACDGSSQASGRSQSGTRPLKQCLQAKL